MAERDYKFTEKQIQEKFLKYKRLSIDLINPELLTRKDLSFVDEFNNFKIKNNQTVNSKESTTKPNNNSNHKNNKNNYVSSSINVLPQRNVENPQVKKEKKREKEDMNNHKEVVQSEYSSFLLKLVASGEEPNQKNEGKSEKTTSVTKKANPGSTPEFNKNHNVNIQPDFFIDTLCSDNLKTTKVSGSKESNGNKEINPNTYKEEKKKINQKVSTKSINTKTKFEDGKNVNNISNGEMFDSFGKKENIIKEEKVYDRKDSLDCTNIKESIKHEKIIKDPSPEVSNFKEKLDEVMNIDDKTNKVNNDSSNSTINKLTDKNIEINDNNLSLFHVKNSGDENNCYLTKVIVPEIKVEQFPQTEVTKEVESKMIFDEPILKKKEPNILMEIEMNQPIDKIKNEIFKGIEQNLKGESKSNFLQETQKQFDSVNKLLGGEIIINKYEKFPEILILIKLIEIVINYEKKLEKRIEYKNIINLVDIVRKRIYEVPFKTEDEGFQGQMKKVFDYIKCNLKIKQYKPEKITKFVSDFNNFCKEKEYATIHEFEENCKDLVKFNQELGKLLEINEKMISFFKSFRNKDFLTNLEFEKLLSNLKMSHFYLNFKIIGKVAMEAMNLIVKHNN